MKEYRIWQEGIENTRENYQGWVNALNPETQKGGFGILVLKKLADHFTALKKQEEILLQIENTLGQRRCLVWRDGECKMSNVETQIRRVATTEQAEGKEGGIEQLKPGKNTYQFGQEELKQWRLTAESFVALQKFLVESAEHIEVSEELPLSTAESANFTRNIDDDSRAWIGLQRLVGVPWAEPTEDQAEKREQQVVERLVELLTMSYVKKKYTGNKLAFSRVTEWIVRKVKESLKEAGFDCSVPEGMSTGSSLLLTDKKIDKLLKKVLQLMDEKTGKTAKFYQQIMAGGELSLQLPAIVEPNKFHQIVIIKK